MRFAKLHGLGNDFVLFDRLAEPSLEIPHDDVPLICSRNLGVGSDGVIVVEKGERAPFRMRMWNPDGSESGMCGNGTRCVARWLFDRLIDGDEFPLEVTDRVVQIRKGPNGFTVGMGQAHLDWGPEWVQGFEGRAISIGNPHFVTFVEDLDAIDLNSLGPRLELDPAFPGRANIHFAQLVGPNHVRQLTWERGAGATLACGSGACAGAVAAVKANLAGPEVRMSLPGGDLLIRIFEDFSVEMTGPAELSFTGDWNG